MKSVNVIQRLTLIVGLFCSFSGFADVWDGWKDLEKNKLDLTTVSGRVTDAQSVEIHCPPKDRDCAALQHTNVTVAFRLAACADELGPVNFSYQVTPSGLLNLSATAIVIRKVKMEGPICSIQPIKTAILQVKGLWSKGQIIQSDESDEHSAEALLMAPENCDMLIKGFVFDATSRRCVEKLITGCRSPFAYTTVAQCLAANQEK